MFRKFLFVTILVVFSNVEAANNLLPYFAEKFNHRNNRKADEKFLVCKSGYSKICKHKTTNWRNQKWHYCYPKDAHSHIESDRITFELLDCKPAQHILNGSDKDLEVFHYWAVHFSKSFEIEKFTDDTSEYCVAITDEQEKRFYQDSGWEVWFASDDEVPEAPEKRRTYNNIQVSTLVTYTVIACGPREFVEKISNDHEKSNGWIHRYWNYIVVVTVALLIIGSFILCIYNCCNNENDVEQIRAIIDHDELSIWTPSSSDCVITVLDTKLDTVNKNDSETNQFLTDSSVSNGDHSKKNEEVEKNSNRIWSKSLQLEETEHVQGSKPKKIIISGDTNTDDSNDFLNSEPSSICKTKKEEIITETEEIVNAKDILPETEEVKSESEEIVPKAKDIAPEAEEIVADAKDILREGKEIVPEAEDIVPETEENVPEAKDLFAEPKDIVSEAKGKENVKEDIVSKADTDTNLI